MKADFKSYSDETLLLLLRRADIVAFEEIYNRYWKRLYSLCYKRVQSTEVSEELVQDIFTSLWANRQKSGIVNLSSYLFAAAKYKVINHISREASRKTYSETLSIVRDNDNSTEEAIFLDDLNRALEREVKKLPSKRQEIFMLHRQKNLSVKQVAAQMGISEKTVENQFGKALKVLKLNLRHFTFLGVFVAHYNDLLAILSV
jgi:RNA polymerase sigma-70 factor (ECF subfamily)